MVDAYSVDGLGVDRLTGGPLTGWDHVRQSISDIILTPIGSRVMRRDYGSAAPNLIDGLMNERAVLALFVSIASALVRWEPRFRLLKVEMLEASAEGRATLRLVGEYLPNALSGQTAGERRTVVLDT